MDYDALALAFVIVTGVALLVTGSLLWFFAFAISGFYGGWRIGQRLIPPEKYGA